MPVDSTPAPAVSVQTNLDCRSFGPSPAWPPGPNHEASTPTTTERACPSLKILLRLLCGRINPSTWIPLGSSRRWARTPRSAAQRPHHRIDPASPRSKRRAAPIARQRFARRPQENLIRIRKTPTRDKRSPAATIGDSLQLQTEPAFGGARSGQKPRRSVGQTVRQRRRLTWKCRSAAAQNRAFCETPRRFAPSSTALRAEAPLSRRCFKTTLVERGAAQTTRPTGFARAPVRLPIPPPPKLNPMNPAQTSNDHKKFSPGRDRIDHF